MNIEIKKSIKPINYFDAISILERRLGDLHKNLSHDRLDTPRVKINKGSVGIVEKFCTIYTFESPGGWNIIGRTPLNLFDINKKNTSLLSPGDTVKFKSITKKEILSFKNE